MNNLAVVLLVIVDRIKKLCIERGIKQQYIFDCLGVNRTLFADWERGKSKPANRHIEAIADILQTTPEYLRGETDKKERPADWTGNKLDNEFIELYKQLSDEQKELIKASVRGIIDAKKKSDK